MPGRPAPITEPLTAEDIREIQADLKTPAETNSATYLLARMLATIDHLQREVDALKRAPLRMRRQ